MKYIRRLQLPKYYMLERYPVHEKKTDAEQPAGRRTLLAEDSPINQEITKPIDVGLLLDTLREWMG